METVIKDACICGAGGDCQCIDISFLDPKVLKEREDKIKSGETVCNTDSPEGCESCSG
jgi:hypothetical protein